MTLPRQRLLSAAVLALVLAPTVASAARRESVTAQSLSARMQAAEVRFTQAALASRNGEPDAQRDSEAALLEMEAVTNACVRTRGCPVSTMLATYNRLLKSALDEELDEAEQEPAAHALGHQAAGSGIPQGAQAAALLGDDHRFDRMVEYNPAVQQSIRRWLTDMRGSLLSSWENYQHMRHLMWPEFQKRGLPEALLFGIMAKESNGKVHATSRAGAAGPMQFMYATGRRFGLGDDGTGFDTRYEPRAAAQASAEYLTERMNQLNGNIEMALAAYNGGEGRALRVYQGAGGRTFWDESVYSQFPAETRDYVPMVIAASWLFLHPKEYGLTLPKVSPRSASLRLAQPASLYQLSICMGNKGVREGYMRTLRNLNPRYQPEAFLSAGTTLNVTTRMVGLYNRWCTTGPRSQLARTLVVSDPSRAVVRAGNLQSMPAEGGEPVMEPGAPSEAGPGAMQNPRPGVGAPAVHPSREYRVQAGESLTSIARKFSCRVDQLARANGIPVQGTLKLGQAIRLEGCSG